MMNKHGPNVFMPVTTQALLSWGLEDFAYLRPTTEDGKPAYAVCAADGSEIAVFDDREIAVVTCRQNDLEPLSVH